MARIEYVKVAPEVFRAMLDLEQHVDKCGL